MATYYVRADGTAVNKAAATDSSSAATSMSVDTFNAETFSPGDFIYFSSKGGDLTRAIILPSSGVSGNIITYAGEPGHLPLITAVNTDNRQNGQSYMDWRDMEADAAQTANFEFSGSALGVTTHNLVARNSGNQCLQHLNSVQVDHYNITTSGALDEGLSMHDNPAVRVFGGSISGYNGINWVGTGSIELYDCTIKSENALGHAIQPAATSYNFKAHRCTIIETVGSAKRLIDFNAAGSVEFANCAFKNLGSTDYYLLLRSTLTTARLMNCTFYSGSITGAVVFNQKTTGLYENNVFHGCTSGSGKGFYASNGVNYTCYYSSGTTYYGATYITTNPLLVDPANDDFHLQAGSPCIGIGSNLSSYFTDDIDGQSRGAVWDIGADEFAGIYREFASSLANSSDATMSVAVSRAMAVPMLSAADLAASAAVNRGMSATVASESSILSDLQTIALSIVSFAATMANTASASGNMAAARSMSALMAVASDSAAAVNRVAQMAASVSSVSDAAAILAAQRDMLATVATLADLAASLGLASEAGRLLEILGVLPIDPLALRIHASDPLALSVEINDTLSLRVIAH